MRKPHALMQPRRTLELAVLASSVFFAGCFKYTPVETVTVPPQEDVRVRVTTDAAMRIGPHLGTIMENLEGRLTPLGTDSLTLAVWIGRDYVGSPFANARQRVSLGRQEVVEVRRRTLSISRTSIVTVGVLALTALIIDRVAFQPSPNPSFPRIGEPPPDPEGVRASWRIRVRY